MVKAHFIVSMLMVCMLTAGLAFGQTYPNKPIRMITAETGGGVDLMARLIAPELAGNLGQQVIIDNRGGANGAIAAQAAAKAAPDGYTLLLYSNVIWFVPLMKDNVPYDPVRDFSPISLTNRQPNILVVHPSLPVKSVKELVALAKARPGELNYASPSTGSTPHLAAELFKSMAGVNIVRVNYKGGGPALNDLIGGQVQLMFAVVGTAIPHVKSGRLRVLAVTSIEPSALVPGLPTVAASGLPGYESGSVYGIFAPAKTPVALINRLNQEIVRALSRADVKERFLSSGVETVGSSPGEFAATIKSGMVKMGKLIKDAGIRAE